MTIPSYVYQGIIAGISGSIAAIASVLWQDKIRRRHVHHIKHKENFGVLESAIRKACSDVYPYISPDNKEKPFMEINYEVNYKAWEVYSIFNYADVISKDTEQYVIKQLDKLLYEDIKKHWPEFYAKLDGWNKKIRETGKKSNEIMKVIFETIRKGINETHVNCTGNSKVIRAPGTQTEKCVLATYNIVMGTNPDEWPNLYSYIEKLELIDTLEKIAEDVKSQREKELNEFHETVDPFLKVAGELLNELDKLIHEEKIKGNCEYI